VPFRIPTLGTAETRIYVTLLLIQAEVGEENPAFQGLLAVSKELLKRPWRNPVLDRSAVEKAMGRLTPAVQSAISLSQQVGRILAEGAKGNPRQIKRFLNSLLLRYAIADARGFAEDIQRPVLAKLMLAERFMPRMFERLSDRAAASEGGRVRALAELERIAQSGREGGAERSKNTDGAKDEKGAPLDAEDAELLETWRKNVAIAEWARLDPPLALEDLRPYLFVTRDRRGYFGAEGGGQLEEWIDKLMAPSAMVVARYEAELRALPAPDLESLFDALRDRVLQAEDKKVTPNGMSGIELLAKVHPPLQRRTVELLEDLPQEDLGPWVVTGWQRIFTDGAVIASFDKLLQKWAEQQENRPLSAAAVATRKIPAGRSGRR
jgi:hypothetical protein